MTTALDRILGRLRRDRGLPFSSLLQKGIRFVVARSVAPVFLRACTRVGARPRTAGRPRILNRGVIAIGDDVVLSSTLGRIELETGPRGRLKVGDDVFLNFGTRVCAEHLVRIGHDVAVGPYSTITDRAGVAGDAAATGIEIGSGVWLGARVTVLAGAKIGAGATITAGSVVAGTIPSGAVAGGVPARVLRLAPEPGAAGAGHAP